MQNLNYFELTSINGGCSGRVGELVGCYYARFRNWLDDNARRRFIESVGEESGKAGYSA